MSGRLIILPKKSWHPGKRENIEKVLKDERVSAEEAAEARERAREVTQEGIVETLSKKRLLEGRRVKEDPEPASRKRRRPGEDKGENDGLGGKGQGWGETPQHVNLFSEAEREAEKKLGQNADYQSEKQEEELRAQRRSGLAPTALGDGSAELKGEDSQPWYMQMNASAVVLNVAARTTRLGREVTGKEAVEALKRDEKRKDRADPLVSLFGSGSSRTIDRTSNENRTKVSLAPRDTLSADARGDTRGDDRGLDGTSTSTRGDRNKSSKKEKKHKHNKHKHKKHKKSRSGRDRDSSRDARRGDSGATAGDDGGSTTDANGQQQLEDLRRRRLAREGGERERQIRLLAERQMAGLPFPDERRISYNNQYNATAARQNRLR